METIAELFARAGEDPSSLQDDDTKRLISYYRENRQRYKTAGTAAPKIDKPRPATLEELGI